MKTIIAPFIGQDIYAQGGVGKLKAEFRKGIPPLSKAIEGLSPTGYNRIISAETGGGTFTRARQLQNYIKVNHSIWDLHNRVITLTCNKTRNQVRMIIRLAIQSSFTNINEPTKIIFTSCNSHLKRIRIYAELYAPKNWVMEYRPVRQGPVTLQKFLTQNRRLKRDEKYSKLVRARFKRLYKSDL